jgi:hypothetical protein
MGPRAGAGRGGERGYGPAVLSPVRAVAALLVGPALLAGCAAGPSGTPATDPPAGPPGQSEAAAPGTALAVLGTLEVKGRAPRTGYDRELFGQRWADTDHNGCDTRNDVLRRDLTSVTTVAGTNGCVVATGELIDPFSGRTISFVRGQGTSELVQVDHVVALSDAWQKGAQQWTPERRLAFANDPLNLLAVDGALNTQKGDGDAATWLPPSTGYRCAYVARQVAVKARYGAWVTAPERDAIAGVLADCPAEPVPGAGPAEPVPGRVPPAPRPDQPGGCDPAYPSVCLPRVEQAGDLDCTDIPQRRFAVLAPDPHRLDNNADGVGCEG